MSQFNVRESINIPYFDHDDSSLKNTIKNSSARRNISPLRFAVRKIRNILLWCQSGEKWCKVVQSGGDWHVHG